jgi:hypothetical protein
MNTKTGLDPTLKDDAQNFETVNPFEPFFSDETKPSPGAINFLNEAYAGAMGSVDRENIKAAWRVYMAS